jgi:hypothetical protein
MSKSPAVGPPWVVKRWTPTTWFSLLKVHILSRYRTQIAFSTFRIDFNVIFHRKIVRLEPCVGKNGKGAGAGDGANGNGQDGFASAAGGDDTQSGDSLSSASTLVTVTAAGVALFATAF